MEKFCKALSILLILALLTAALAACGGGTASSQASTAAPAGSGTGSTAGTAVPSGAEGEPQYGGTLKIAINRAIKAQGIDPLFSDSTACEFVIQNYLDTLVIEDANRGGYYPNLATHWETSEDGMTWTFYLRDDVHFQKGAFQDGRLMTADDVLFTFERESKSFNKFLNSIDTVEKIDDFTVAFHLVEPDAIFLNTIVNTSAGIVCKEEVEGWGDEEFCYHPIGTGPFQVTEHVPEQYTKAVRNENYWGVKPYLDAVEWHIISDPAQAMNALLTGEIDINPYVVGDGILQVQNDSSLILEQGPENRIALVGFNTSNEKLSDVRVRKALTHAVDYEQLASTMRNGEGSPNWIPLPQTNWGWDQALADSVPTYDVELAKQLLAEVGVTDLELEVIYVSDEARTRAVTMLESFWKEIGVTLVAKQVAQSELTDIYASGTGEVWAASQGGTGDPATFPGYFLSTGRLGTNFNPYAYSDPATDELIALALSTTDQDERKAVYEQLTQIMIDECLGIFYGTVNLSWGIRDNVHGYVQESKQFIRLTGVEESGINIWVDQ